MNYTRQFFKHYNHLYVGTFFLKLDVINVEFLSIYTYIRYLFDIEYMRGVPI